MINALIQNKIINKAKPFVKWAGGKGQLLETFKEYYPKQLKDGKISRYVEPFVGGGAVLFDILQNYEINEAYIFDVNKELINVYNVIKNNVEHLILMLSKIEEKYKKLSEEERKVFYYKMRDEYNNYIEFDVKKAAYFIFLNKTCFNGLYRVNSKGEFNVPFGDYKNPKICDAENLYNVSLVLSKVKIFCSDYKKSIDFIDEDTFVYFDPPYRPISKTSNFTSYNEISFDDNAQIELAKFYKETSETGAYLMLSNSDPKNIDENDNFFDELYKDFNIFRIKAKRYINSKADKRGNINEILVLNY